MKKKLLSLLLLTSVIFSFCSCSSTDENETNTERSVIMISEPPSDEPAQESSESNDEPVDSDESSGAGNTESSPDASVYESGSGYDTVEFPMLSSDENKDKQPHFILGESSLKPVRLKDKITVTPVEIYYNQHQLVAKCLIYNGYSHMATKIYADWISLQDRSGEIACASFDLLKNLTVDPGTAEMYTFTFNFTDIKNLRSGLDSIRCEYYCHCKLDKTTEEFADEKLERSKLVPEPHNIFFNHKDIKKVDNEISFTPAGIYYENDTLVLCCFVHNGYSSKVCNINVHWYKLYNDDGLIAEYNLGKMKNTVIPAGDYILYKFKIPYEGIKVYNANLRSTISWDNFYDCDIISDQGERER